MENTRTSIEGAIEAAVRQAVESVTAATAPPQQSKTGPFCMTVKQLAERMQISMPTAYNLTHIEGFPVIALGKRRLIPIPAFETWLEQQAGKSFQ